VGEIDVNGNIYAAGSQKGGVSCEYSDTVSVASDYSGIGVNVLLVKYDTNGNALWARSVNGGGNTSLFASIATDSSGNIYVTGYQEGTGSYNYGSSVSVTGSSALHNAVLVKYDTNGNTLWAKSSSNINSSLESITMDSSENIYVVGYYHDDTENHDNAVLIKYDKNGNTLWEKSGTGSYSYFFGVATDFSGNIYAAGYHGGFFNYGGTVPIVGPGMNVVLVKYDANGNPQWAKSVTGSMSYFFDVATDFSGNIYATGYQRGPANYHYDEDAVVAGSFTGGNAVLVKYLRQ
jgi:hypothetical protein